MSENIHICEIYKNCIKNRLQFNLDILDIEDRQLASVDTHLLSLLHYAVIFKDIVFVQYLLEKNIDVNMPGTIMKRTPLFFSSDPDITILLISYGADVNLVDNDLNTPLHCVIERFLNEEEEKRDILCFSKNIKALLWNGSNPSTTNSTEISSKDLYYKIFPNENNDGEDEEVKEMMRYSDEDLQSDSESSVRDSDMISSVESLEGR